MEVNFTPFDEKKLIYLLQKSFPLTSRPFDEIAKHLQTEEKLVLEVLRSWQKNGKLRQISAIFNPPALGHSSSLFAFKVPEKNLKKAESVINAHPGVSHNYLRNHTYNFWFTLVVPPGMDLLKEAEYLLKESGAEDFLYLPIIKVFKIAAVFDVESLNNFEENPLENKDEIFPFSELDKNLVKLLQEPLPLVPEPFKVLAEKLGLKEEFIFEWLNNMKEKGALRRFAGLFRHVKLGYKRNIMVAWLVPEERIVEVGQKLSKYTFITHCYLRRSYPRWPYNIYTMCHFKEEGFETIKNISQELSLSEFLPLETLRELKKIRLKLFYTKN